MFGPRRRGSGSSRRRASEMLGTRPRAAQRDGALPALSPTQPVSAAAKRRLRNAGFAVAAIVIFFWSVLPVLALILMSLSPAADLIRTPPTVIPSAFTLDNFVAVLAAEGLHTSAQAKRVPLSLMNSFFVGVVGLGDQRRRSERSPATPSPATHAPLLSSGGLWAPDADAHDPGLTLVLPFFIIFPVSGSSTPAWPWSSPIRRSCCRSVPG